MRIVGLVFCMLYGGVFVLIGLLPHLAKLGLFPHWSHFLIVPDEANLATQILVYPLSAIPIGMGVFIILLGLAIGREK